MRIARARSLSRGREEDRERDRCGSARYYAPSDDHPWIRSLSTSLAHPLSLPCSFRLCSEPAFRRHVASCRTPAGSHFSSEPHPTRLEGRGGRDGVVLLIARNHAFHPRTPRPRPRCPFLSSTRKLVRCTLDRCTASRPPRRTRRSYEIHPVAGAVIWTRYYTGDRYGIDTCSKINT